MKFKLVLFFIFVSFQSFSALDPIYPTSNKIKNLLEYGEDIHNEYQGQVGLIKFTYDFFFGDLKKTYEHTTAALGKDIVQRMGWNNFLGVNSLLGRQVKKNNTQQHQPFLQEAHVISIEKEDREFQEQANNLGTGVKQELKLLAKAFEEEAWRYEEEARRMERERLMIRETLEISDGEIDYAKWSGKDDGLNRAIMEVMEKAGYLSPYSIKDKDIIRSHLKDKAVSQIEAQALGWEDSKITSKAGLRNFSNNLISSRRILERIKKLGTSVKDAIQRGMRK